MSRTALFEAARAWDAKAVARILKHKPDLVGARDHKGRTALEQANRKKLSARALAALGDQRARAK